MSAISRLCGWSAVAILCGALGAQAAHAECARAYVGDELIADLSTMTTSLRSLDEAAFRAAGQRLEANLGCVREQVPPPVFATAYRFIGAYHFFAGDEKEARRWFRVSLELAPTFVWDVNDFELNHPLRRIFDEERAVASIDPTPVQGKVLNVPAGSDLYLDGRKLDVPAATPDRPHLLQVIATSDQTVRQVFFIEGDAFPELFLRDESMVVSTEPDDTSKDKSGRHKKDQKPEADADAFAVIQIKRVRPPAKTPMMITGGVVMAGGAVLYAMSFASHDEFMRATTTDDMERYRTVTNTLVVASGATIALGMGIGYAGVMLDAGPGLIIGGRF